MKLKVQKIWIDPADVAGKLAAKILETDINIYSDGDFWAKVTVEHDFNNVQIGETEVEINIEVKGILSVKNKDNFFTERYLSDSTILNCYIDGEEVPFNDDEIFKSINNLIKISNYE